MLTRQPGTRPSFGALIALFLLLPTGLAAEPILRIDPGEHTAMIQRIAAEGLEIQAETKGHPLCFDQLIL